MVQSRVTKAAALMLALCSGALAQLNQNCTVSVLNRSVPVNPDGSWVLPNIPANFGQVKARATCVQNGQTIFGESAFFNVPANSAVNLPAIILGITTAIPVSLKLGPTGSTLTTAGQSVQLTVTATYPDNSTKDVSAGSSGTNYTISNPAIASITANGLVTAVSSGTVVIQAMNDGASGILTLQVNLGGVTIGGIPLSWLIATHLDPNDPTVPFEDPDRDGLTNLQEYQNGTDPNNPDTDADGLSDGDEVNKYFTNPLLPDTDGDKIPDGIEVQTGTDPLNPNSYDLQKATATSILTPPSFSLSTSPLFPTVSAQLNWKVNLIDGKTILDLTADPRTSYRSSNLSVCNFGVQPGLVFAGSSTGSCVITINQNTLTVTDSGQVTSFTPTEVSTLGIPGSVAVDVGANFAYVALGSGGLVVVDVNSRSTPRTRGTLSGLGNAVGIRVAGQYVLIADATGFLRVVQVSNPDAPSLVGSLAIAGAPNSVAVHGTLVAVAAQSGGVSLVDISTPTTPSLISTIAVSGSALGVDFDLIHNIAAVAMGGSGLQLAGISNQAAPKLLGLLPGGNVLQVRLVGTVALLADSSRSVTAVDVSNPANPVLSSSEAGNLGGAPVDITFSGNVAITADHSFGRAVPVISIANPLQPNTVLYWTISPPGFGSSIAMDASFGYLIIPGTLRIFQYQNIVDTAGIPPTVQITNPTPGTTLIQGSTITITVNASDDVAVASVSFLVNGQVVSTTATQPYQLTYSVPKNATSLTVGAIATDYGNLTGTASVTVPVIPDPGTTVSGMVIDGNGNPVSGAPVTTVGSASSTTAADGSFSIAGVSTIRGNIQVFASFTQSGTTLGGTSGSFPPVRGGTTLVGAITILPIPVIGGLSAKSALAGSQVSLKVTGTTLGGATFAFQPATSPPITIQVQSTSADRTSAALALNIPSTSIGTFALVATTAAGNSGSIVTVLNRFTSVNPNSTADTDGDGFQDVIEAVFGTDPLDPLSFPVIPVLTETEGVAFSVLNAPVTGAGIVETEGVAFSLLNAPVTGAGIVQTESVAFSVLNAPVTGAGIVQTESTAFSVLNAPTQASGIVEAEAVPVGVRNTATAAPAPTIKVNGSEVKTEASTPLPPFDPFLDTDGDGLPDWYELLIGTDPYNPDTDGDGLTDFEEVFTYHTKPLAPDTDSDGFFDGVEILFGSDPLNPESTPLNFERRAAVAQPGSRNVAMVAANHKIQKKSTRQGGTHVKQRSKKVSHGKDAAIRTVSGSFVAGRSGD